MMMLIVHHSYDDYSKPVWRYHLHRLQSSKNLHRHHPYMMIVEN